MAPSVTPQSFAALRSQSLKQLFGIFTQEMAHQDGLQLMTRELFLILLGAELNRLCEKEDRGRFPYRLSRSTLQLVLDHMEAHLGSKNSVPDLAKLARCTPDHFIRLFREATSTTKVGRSRFIDPRPYDVQDPRHGLPVIWLPV